MDAARRHAALVARLREREAASDRILDAFARVPRHQFLPGVAAKVAYSDDAIVTHDEGGVPTSSSSQPSLMARMLEQLDLRAGDRVLEIGTGTGYNAALIAELGAAVTSVELQPEVAAAARGHLRALGIPTTSATTAPATRPGGAGTGAAGRAGLRARDHGRRRGAARRTLRAHHRDGRLLVAAGRRRRCARRRRRARRAAARQRRRGGARAAARGRRAQRRRRDPVRLHADARRRRAALALGAGGGGSATADADLGVEGRGALDRLLAEPGRAGRGPARAARRRARARRDALARPAGRPAAVAIPDECGEALPFRGGARQATHSQVAGAVAAWPRASRGCWRSWMPCAPPSSCCSVRPPVRRSTDRASASGARVVVGSTGRRSSRACGPVPCTRPSTQHPSCAPGRVRRRSTRSSRTSSWRRRPFRRLATMPSEAGHRTLTGKSGEVPLPHDRWRRPSAALPWR